MWVQGTLLYYTQNYGNSTQPLLDLGLTFMPTQYAVVINTNIDNSALNQTTVTVDESAYNLNQFPLIFWWDINTQHTLSIHGLPANYEFNRWITNNSANIMQNDYQTSAFTRINGPGQITAELTLSNSETQPTNSSNTDNTNSQSQNNSEDTSQGQNADSPTPTPTPSSTPSKYSNPSTKIEPMIPPSATINLMLLIVVISLALFAITSAVVLLKIKKR